MHHIREIARLRGDIEARYRRIQDLGAGVTSLPPDLRPDSLVPLFRELEDHLEALEGNTPTNHLEQAREIPTPNLDRIADERQRTITPREAAEAAEQELRSLTREGTATQRGLDIIAQQPRDLRNRLNLQLSAISERAVTMRILQRINRVFGPDSTPELRGVSRFLEYGDPDTLVRILSVEATEVVPTSARMHQVSESMSTIAEMSPEAIRGMEAFSSLAEFRAGNELIAIFQNFDYSPNMLNGIFESILRFEELSGPGGRINGLERLVSHLAGGNPANWIGAQGQLLAANQILTRYPDAILTFEDPVTRTMLHFQAVEGEHLYLQELRYTDIRVDRPGQPCSSRVEVKEWHVLNREDHVLAQLARDIFLDWEARRLVHRSSQPFETITWMIRGEEIEPQALRSRLLEVFDYNDAAVIRDGGARDRIREALEIIPEVELQRYREAVAAMEFVEFF
jgi:hypothetical protein